MISALVKATILISLVCMGIHAEQSKSMVTEPEIYTRSDKAKIGDNSDFKVGQIIDRLNGVAVFYNGSMSNVSGRNTTADGYNLGLKYQCVEFVKRYYYEYYDHKMPDSYGHAKDFFDNQYADGETNPERALYQYTNGSSRKPSKGDIVIYGGTTKNKFGHTGIISKVANDHIELVQQNVGYKSRILIPMIKHKERFYLSDKTILGWLSIFGHED